MDTSERAWNRWRGPAFEWRRPWRWWAGSVEGCESRRTIVLSILAFLLLGVLVLGGDLMSWAVRLTRQHLVSPHGILAALLAAILVLMFVL